MNWEAVPGTSFLRCPLTGKWTDGIRIFSEKPTEETPVEQSEETPVEQSEGTSESSLMPLVVYVRALMLNRDGRFTKRLTRHGVGFYAATGFLAALEEEIRDVATTETDTPPSIVAETDETQTST